MVSFPSPLIPLLPPNHRLGIVAYTCYFCQNEPYSMTKGASMPTHLLAPISTSQNFPYVFAYLFASRPDYNKLYAASVRVLELQTPHHIVKR